MGLLRVGTRLYDWQFFIHNCLIPPYFHSLLSGLPSGNTARQLFSDFSVASWIFNNSKSTICWMYVDGFHTFRVNVDLDTARRDHLSCLGHTLIGNGWPVLPLCWTDGDGNCACGRHTGKKGGKAPLTQHGVNDATNNAEQVTVWAAKWPVANWGVACGALTVLDIDDAELASQLKEDAALLAEHFMVATPRGNGVHIYVIEEIADQRSRVLKSQDRRRLGDLQRAGKYVVGPGSSIAGQQYTALNDNPPAKVEDAEVWLADMLERFGVALRRSRQTETTEWSPIDSGGVDADAALGVAIKDLAPSSGDDLCELLQNPERWAKFSSQSDADFAAVSNLIEAGLSDTEVAAVWRHSPLGQRDKMRRKDYMARTIANARQNSEAFASVVGTSARVNGSAKRATDDSIVEEAIKTSQVAVDFDLLHEINYMPRLVESFQELLDQLAQGVPLDPGTVQKMQVAFEKGPLLIRAAPGVGKTHRVVKLAEETDMVLYRPILHAVPSHKSFDNVRRKPYWEHWEGHSKGDDRGNACPAYVRGNKGYALGRDCTCGWIPADADADHLPTVAPVEYLLADTPDGPPLRPEALDFPMWVFDDIGLAKFVDTTVITRRDVELTAQYHPRESAKSLARALLLVLDWHTVENQGRSIDDEQNWSASELIQQLESAFAKDELSVETWELNAAQEILEHRQEMWPDQPWVPRHLPAAHPLPLNFMGKLFNPLISDCNAHLNCVPRNPSVHVVWDSPKHGQPKQSIVRLNRRRYLPREAVHKTVVLDASGDPDLWSTALGAPVTLGETSRELISPERMPFPEGIRVVQLRDTHLSKSTLRHFDGDGKVTLSLKYRDLLKWELQARRELGQARQVGIITYQELIPDCINALQELGYTHSDDPEQSQIVTGYYYNLRGANEFIGCDVLVLLGFPGPNPQGLYEEACALFQDDPEPISVDQDRYSDRIRLRNGHSIPLAKMLFGYSDPRLQALLRQTSREELYQAFHRGRPFAPKTSVQEVLLFTDVPVPGVPVDTFFGRDGGMFDCLTDLLGDGDVTVPQLVDAFTAVCGPDGATRESLLKWVRGKNSAWLAEATGTEFVPGRGKGHPGVFRTRTIPKYIEGVRII
jgi:hypothetical protein